MFATKRAQLARTLLVSRRAASSVSTKQSLTRTELESYKATNEPILEYKKGSVERTTLHATLLDFLSVAK